MSQSDIGQLVIVLEILIFNNEKDEKVEKRKNGHCNQEKNAKNNDAVHTRISASRFIGCGEFRKEQAVAIV